MKNLELCNGWVLMIQPPVQVLMQTDALNKGWRGGGATCNGISICGKSSVQEMRSHINVLELSAIKVAILTFTKKSTFKSLDSQVDNLMALTYLPKMRGLKILN